MRQIIYAIGMWAGLVLSASAAPSAFTNCAADLPFGIPKVTTTDPLAPVCHPGYAALEDEKLRVPRWVAYRLTADHVFGCLPRKNDFHPDEELPAAEDAAPKDYAHSGYDQGHMAPAEDFAWNAGELHDSFSMANMSPQLAGLNRQGWERLEEDVRAWAWRRKTLIVYVGPVISPNDASLPDGRVTVPTAFWKVIVDPVNKQAIGFELPQQAIPKTAIGASDEKSIADIEADAKIRLPLPNGVSVSTTPAFWSADLTGFRRQHKLACGSH